MAAPGQRPEGMQMNPGAEKISPRRGQFGLSSSHHTGICWGEDIPEPISTPQKKSNQ